MSFALKIGPHPGGIWAPATDAEVRQKKLTRTRGARSIRGILRHGGLSGWVDGPLAIDVMRAVKLEQNGYEVRTQTIPVKVTPKNRLLVALPISPCTL